MPKKGPVLIWPTSGGVLSTVNCADVELHSPASSYPENETLFTVEAQFNRNRFIKAIDFFLFFPVYERNIAIYTDV